MKFLCIIILLVLNSFLLAAQKPSAPKNADASFNNFKERFILSLWKQYPSWASSQGFHKYDSELTVPNDESRNKSVQFCNLYLDSLKKIDVSQLSDNNKTDYKMMASELQSRKWYTQVFKSYEWNPSNYNVCSDFAEMLANDYDKLDTRLRNFYIKMNNVKAYYDAAKINIKNPTAEHTKLAIDQNQGGITTFDEDLKVALDKSTIKDDEKRKIENKAKEVTATIKEYISFLQNLKNDKPRSFRIGKELYSKKFEYDIESSFTASEMFDKAMQHKNELHEQMYTIVQKLWPTYMQGVPMPTDKLIAIKKMIDVLSLKHTDAKSFQEEIERQIPTLVNFVKEKNLLYLDPAKPLVVRKEPAYMAGVAGASISAPGPYDKNGNTYYNVGSISNWDKEKAKSYLQEYNYYILQILNIHEAIPGHYAQLIYANQSPSIIKTIFGNGAMIEGWAVYTEKMMLENGYGKIVTISAAPPVAVQVVTEETNISGEVVTPTKNTDIKMDEASPEMWLMYCKWNLRSTCNTILDYNVHVNNLSKEDALKFLTEEAFQQYAEAEGKWKRVSVTQVQLASYFTGYTEIMELRDELKKKQGTGFNLKAFHEKFLSYGSAPVKYISELMLK